MCIFYSELLICPILMTYGFFFFWLFRAEFVAYLGSRARDPIQSCSHWPTRGTGTPDLSLICDLHHCSWQQHILKPLSEVRDQTWVLMNTTHICYHWTMMGTSPWVGFLTHGNMHSKLTAISQLQFSLPYHGTGSWRGFCSWVVTPRSCDSQYLLLSLSKWESGICPITSLFL